MSVRLLPGQKNLYYEVKKKHSISGSSKATKVWSKVFEGGEFESIISFPKFRSWGLREEYFEKRTVFHKVWPNLLELRIGICYSFFKTLILIREIGNDYFEKTEKDYRKVQFLLWNKRWKILGDKSKVNDQTKVMKAQNLQRMCMKHKENFHNPLQIILWRLHSISLSSSPPF